MVHVGQQHREVTLRQVDEGAWLPEVRHGLDEIHLAGPSGVRRLRYVELLA